MIKGTILLFCFGVCLAKPAPQQPAGEYPEVVPIVSQQNEIEPDGHYSYSFESGDGTAQQQTGTVKVFDDVSILAVQGQYSFVDDEGNPHTVTYTADENGFHAEGDVLPQAPPVPEIIAKALKYIEEHPYAEEEQT